MLADEAPEMGARGPRAFGGSPVTVHLYVNDVDATVKTAVAEGAKVVAPVDDKFYGDRSGTIEDPFGHHWHVSTHKEDVSPDEMARRAAALGKPS
jgi:PhnB protein